MSGLGLATHYDINSLNDIQNGLFKTEFTVIVKTAKNIIRQYDASMAANGMMPASVYQFRAKNFYGMKDVQEVKVAPKSDLEPENAREIIEQIPDQLEAGKQKNEE